MADISGLDRVVAQARAEMQQAIQRGTFATAAAHALDALTVPLLSAVDELQRIRELLEAQRDA